MKDHHLFGGALMNKISVVVIGRNDEEKLRSIYSTEYVRSLNKRVTELIYVDSDSSDQSRVLMESKGFRVYSLSGSGVLSPSAGRKIGTVHATGDYVLYLDSDMKIPEIGEFFDKLFCKLAGLSYAIGIVGKVSDHYSDGRVRVRVRKSNKKGRAQSFGGFSVLYRKAVLDAGNWNAQLYSFEEQELYARLRMRKLFVEYDPTIDIQHLTYVESPLSELFSAYFPTRSRRYGGLGKALRAKGHLFSKIELILMNREVFISLAVVIFAVFSMYWLAVLILAVMEIDMLQRRSWKYNIVLPGVIIATVIGLLSVRESKEVVINA